MDMIAAAMGLVMLLSSLVVGFLVRKRLIPPISTGYIMSSDEGKERQKQDQGAISFVSNVFFMIAFASCMMLLMVIFPNIKAFEYLTFILVAFILIYVIFKSISYEIYKNK